MAGKGHKSYTIRTIWGIAKSPELSLTSEELHLLVEAQTGKASISKLTTKEIGIVVNALSKLKDSAAGGQKGNASTEGLRKKIYKLQEALEWDEKRTNGMCRKMFHIDKVEWLNYKQCIKLIEALKSMLQRARKEV